jgi:hypothetical protein
LLAKIMGILGGKAISFFAAQPVAALFDTAPGRGLQAASMSKPS